MKTEKVHGHCCAGVRSVHLGEIQYHSSCGWDSELVRGKRRKL